MKKYKCPFLHHSLGEFTVQPMKAQALKRNSKSPRASECCKQPFKSVSSNTKKTSFFRISKKDLRCTLVEVAA